MSTAIAITSLTKAFGKTRAVDGISLDIEPGELFFLLGPSGCGKTTLLRMIAGFIEPTKGSIRFNDRDVTRAPANQRNTGMVFQSYALWPHMTIEANVGFGLQVRKVAGEERRRRVQEALEAVRMGGYGQRRPNQLSGGQQQRVALARALVVRPDVLLLDEPLSNLDAKLRIELRSEIRRICKESGITTVYVTHDQKEALSMADRVAILESGRVVQVGAPRELYRAPRTKFVAEFLGETNLIEASAVVEDDSVVCTSSAGVIRAASSDEARSGDVLLSIRPESIRLSPDGAIRGRVLESTYLGEIAHHVIETGDVKIRVAELNPAGTLQEGEVGLSVDPDDVVVLPR